MLTATLQRNSTGEFGTFGTLTIGGQELKTGELPDKDNAENISCIPPGKYICKKTPSARFGHSDFYQVMDVPGRSGVRFHPANFFGDEALGHKSELNGCITLGRKHGPIEVSPGHTQLGCMASKSAFETLNQITGGEPFMLEILPIPVPEA